MPVNLLAWRERQQFHHGIILIFAVAAINFVVLIGLLICSHGFMSQFQLQQQRNQFLQQQINQYSITSYQKQYQQYDHALRTFNSIQKIRERQIVLLAAWQALVQALPHTGLRLSKLGLTQRYLEIEGAATHSQLIMSLITTLQQLPEFDHLLLQHIEQIQPREMSSTSNGVVDPAITEFSVAGYLSRIRN